MQPFDPSGEARAAEIRKQRLATLTLLIVLGIGAFAVLFFLRTGDAIILIFGIIAAAMVALVMHFLARGGAGASGGSPSIMVRCRACGHLNPERARYCNQCGKNV